jgi:hypothetical protein
MVTVTATNGRTTIAEIEGSMLTPLTLAKALLFRLHRIVTHKSSGEFDVV